MCCHKYHKPLWWQQVVATSGARLVPACLRERSDCRIQASCCRSGWPVQSLRLVSGKQELEDGRSLQSYGITDEASLSVLARLLGGGKKRKKKTYTKPKKQKHKPKKIKLRILKYYKVGRPWLCTISALSSSSLQLLPTINSI